MLLPALDLKRQKSFSPHVVLVGLGVQWELPGALARRGRNHALGFYLNPGPRGSVDATPKTQRLPRV
jgi:hypothetical protein